jgi:hypothetical protein
MDAYQQACIKAAIACNVAAQTSFDPRAVDAIIISLATELNLPIAQVDEDIGYAYNTLNASGFFNNREYIALVRRLNKANRPILTLNG